MSILKGVGLDSLPNRLTCMHQAKHCKRKTNFPACCFQVLEGFLTYEGCFMDSFNRGFPVTKGRTLGYANTPENCAIECGESHRYIGVQDGAECYCGNELPQANGQPYAQVLENIRSATARILFAYVP